MDYGKACGDGVSRALVDLVVSGDGLPYVDADGGGLPVWVVEAGAVEVRLRLANEPVAVALATVDAVVASVREWRDSIVRRCGQTVAELR